MFCKTSNCVNLCSPETAEMPHERPLQQLPCVSEQLEGSMLYQAKRTKELDTENTPQDLIQCWSPPHKQPRIIAKGKENTDTQFVLARRPRRKKELAGLSWDSLPDELLLGIFSCLCLRDLLGVSRVCRRWRRLAFDEYLWSSVDLMGVARLDAALSQLLPAGVVTLRCPRSWVGTPRFTQSQRLWLQRADLSNCMVSPAVLGDILSRCEQLQSLSLEGLQLSDSILMSLAQNSGLKQLNLCGCSSFSPESLGDMLKACSRLEELNISWCDFRNDHVKAIVDNLCSGVTQLNISGYRQNLTMEDAGALMERCSSITHLDLSDSVLMTTDIFPVLQRLTSLRHLALSRCYHINLAALVELEKFPALRTLEVFGLVQDGFLAVLSKGLSRILINTRCFSSIGRPTPADCKDGSVWGHRCRLSYRC